MQVSLVELQIRKCCMTINHSVLVSPKAPLHLFFYSDYKWSFYSQNINYVTGLRDPGSPTLPRELFCQFAQATEAVRPQLTEDAGEHLCQLLGLSVACNGEGVGG